MRIAALSVPLTHALSPEVLLFHGTPAADDVYLLEEVAATARRNGRDDWARWLESGRA